MRHENRLLKWYVYIKNNVVVVTHVIRKENVSTRSSKNVVFPAKEATFVNMTK